jgi:hypothetical protein
MLCFVSNKSNKLKELSLNGFPASSLVHFDTPFRWTEPGTWPWFLYIWLAFFLGGWLLQLWRWLRREQAKSWPTTTGRIDSAYIAEPKRLLGLTLQPNRSRTYDAFLAYSYTLSGDTFRGKYKRSLGSEGEAWEFLRDLEGQSIPVQYNSNYPARCVLLEATVETLLRSRPPLPDSHDAEWVDSLPSWLKPLIGFFAFLSLIGLLTSIWVHVGALFGRRVAPEYFFALLHVGIFIVFFPAILVAQKRVGSTNRKDFWKAVTKGSPDGLRYLLYFFFAYAFINFFIFIVQALPGTAPKDQNPAAQWRGFSGHWMLFYCASFVILSSALHSSRQRT